VGVEYLMSPVIPTPTLTLGFGFLRRSTACILAGVPRQGGGNIFSSRGCWAWIVPDNPYAFPPSLEVNKSSMTAC